MGQEVTVRVADALTGICECVLSCVCMAFMKYCVCVQTV
jgi:hypothetical protein